MNTQENIPDYFINSTYFIIPFWVEDFNGFTVAFDRDSSKWTKNILSFPYLLSYTNKIATSENLFRQYQYTHPEEIKPETKRQQFMNAIEKTLRCQDEKVLAESFMDNFEISEVLVSVFGTGVGFFEFKVQYGNLPINMIIEFSYIFKNMRNKQKYENMFLDDITQMLCPEGINITPFFYCSDELKHDCLCYHMIKLKPEEVSGNDVDSIMYHLGRAYGSSFVFDEKSRNADNSKYEFRYSPHENDNWSGSQEALANVCYERDDDENHFLRTFKYTNLLKGYHFQYLMILNQRLTAIKYIEQIIELGMRDSKELRKLNQNIVQLKTVYSLRVISSDMLHQNVYSHLYEIMDIDNLLYDLQDNEQQVESLQKAKAEEFERITGIMVAVLSVLAIFSALIDAADYFNLFPGFPWPAKWASLATAIIGVLLGIGIFFLIKRKRR